MEDLFYEIKKYKKTGIKIMLLSILMFLLFQPVFRGFENITLITILFFNSLYGAWLINKFWVEYYIGNNRSFMALYSGGIDYIYKNKLRAFIIIFSVTSYLGIITGGLLVSLMLKIELDFLWLVVAAFISVIYTVLIIMFSGIIGIERNSKTMTMVVAVLLTVLVGNPLTPAMSYAPLGCLMVAFVLMVLNVLLIGNLSKKWKKRGV